MNFTSSIFSGVFLSAAMTFAPQAVQTAANAAHIVRIEGTGVISQVWVTGTPPWPSYYQPDLSDVHVRDMFEFSAEFAYVQSEIRYGGYFYKYEYTLIPLSIHGINGLTIYDSLGNSGANIVYSGNPYYPENQIFSYVSMGISNDDTYCMYENSFTTIASTSFSMDMSHQNGNTCFGFPLDELPEWAYSFGYQAFGEITGVYVNGRQIASLGDAFPLLPEPGSWAMLILGFGATGFALRRKEEVLSQGRG